MLDPGPIFMFAELLEWEFVAQLLVGKHKSRKNIHLQRNAENSVISQMFPTSTSAYSRVISPL